MNNKLQYLQPAISEREQLLKDAGTDDYTLTDAYNREHGTRLNSPLPLNILREYVYSR